MKKLFGARYKKNAHDAAEHWISVSDLMSGLMMVFLFISVAFMRHVMIERDKIKQVAVAYQENQVELYNKLQREFSRDLARWNAEIDRDTLSFQFKSPDILFANGSSEINPIFRLVLSDFFPRYMKVLGEFKASINEVRIEGHTSSHWRFDATPEESYLRNMELSQARTRSVLFFVQGLPQIQADRDWVKRNIAAVGLSSSKLILRRPPHLE